MEMQQSPEIWFKWRGISKERQKLPHRYRSMNFINFTRAHKSHVPWIMVNDRLRWMCSSWLPIPPVLCFGFMSKYKYKRHCRAIYHIDIQLTFISLTAFIMLHSLSLCCIFWGSPCRNRQFSVTLHLQCLMTLLWAFFCNFLLWILIPKFQKSSSTVYHCRADKDEPAAADAL